MSTEEMLDKSCVRILNAENLPLVSAFKSVWSRAPLLDVLDRYPTRREEILAHYGLNEAQVQGWKDDLDAAMKLPSPRRSKRVTRIF